MEISLQNTHRAWSAKEEFKKYCITFPILLAISPSFQLLHYPSFTCRVLRFSSTVTSNSEVVNYVSADFY